MIDFNIYTHLFTELKLAIANREFLLIPNNHEISTFSLVIAKIVTVCYH